MRKSLPVILMATALALAAGQATASDLLESMAVRVYDVEIRDGLAFMAATSGLVILDISDPASPADVARLDLPDSCAALDVSGNLVFVANGIDGLKVIDISKPKAPVLTGSLQTAGAACDVEVYETTAYVADGAGGLLVIDVSNPATPALVSSHPSAGYARGLAVAGGLVLVADGSAGLAVFEVRESGAPTLLARLDTLGDARDVLLAGEQAFVADGSMGVLSIDMADPANPRILGNLALPDVARGLALGRGGYLLAAGGSNGLHVLDVARDGKLTETGSIDTEGSANAIMAAGRRAYVADDSKGLLIVDLKSPKRPKALNPPETK